MPRPRSFRTRLAFRFTGTMGLGIAAISVISYLSVRSTQDRNLDASILNVASIQAGSVTDLRDGGMHFHEWELTPDEAASVRELNRYAQVWSGAGESLLRTRYITDDLPLDTAALRRAVEGELVWREGTFQGLPIRSLYYPLVRHGPAHRSHVLQVAAPLHARNRLLERVGVFLVAISLLVTGGTFAGSWWLADRSIDPIRAIIDQAEEIGGRSLDRRIDAYADAREYRRLVRVLNTMLDRLDAAFEAQRRFTADASHELRSPLTALRGELELARRRERAPDEYRRVIDSALEEAERLSRIAEDLLTLARYDAGVMEPRLREVDFSDPVERTVDRLRPRADESPVTVTLERSGDTRGVYDPDLLGRLAWNLVQNAIKFTPPGGEVAVSVRGTDREVVLRVQDTGPGVPPGATDRIFERFYQADESRTPCHEIGGTGLGLSIVRAIARAHGGEAAAENRDEGGARFTVRVPRRPGSGSPAAG